MQWFCDRTGYPVLALREIGLAVHLLPVAKRQFECFLAEPGSYGDGWYESLLEVSPRLAVSAATPAAYEMLFASGLFPHEAQEFARWLGDGFELPRAEDWREIYQALDQERIEQANVDALLNDAGMRVAARTTLDWIVRNLRPQTWAEFALMRGGLLEWVRVEHGSFGAFGMPRNEFQVVIVNPGHDAPVRPVYESRRYGYFGFRLKRALPDSRSD